MSEFDAQDFLFSIDDYRCIELIASGLGDKLGLLVRGFSMFISSIIYCLLVDWPLTLVSLSMGPISAMILALMSKVIAKYSQRMLETSGQIYSTIEEAVMNVKTVAACNGQRHMIDVDANFQNQISYIDFRSFERSKTLAWGTVSDTTSGPDSLTG